MMNPVDDNDESGVNVAVLFRHNFISFRRTLVSPEQRVEGVVSSS